MKKPFLLQILSLTIVLFAALQCRAAEFGSLPITEFYAYDQKAPLNAILTPQPGSGGYTLYRVDFDGVWGRRVPGLFMVPLNLTKPCPAIIFGHGYTGSKDDVRSALDKVASAGFCMLSIDMWYHGDRKVEGKKMYSRDLYQMREGLALSVIDLRRAVDFLQSRKEVNPDKISYVGGSMGGILGGLFAGMDSRVQAPVFIVGGGDWPYLLRNSIVGQVDLGLDYNETQRMAREAAKALAPTDTLNTVQYIAPRPMLMINAKHDILVNPFSNKEMFLRAGPPKKIIWFDSDHGVPIDDAIGIMLKWHDDYLINGRTPDFTASVEGYKTTPLAINDKIKLPPIVTELSVNEYLRYSHDMPLLSSGDSYDSLSERVSKYKITFQSAHDRFVNGILNIPTKGASPYPCVVFVHDLGGTPDDVEIIADILARNGIASIAVGVYGFLTGQVNQMPMQDAITGNKKSGNGGDPDSKKVNNGQASADYYVAESNIYTARNLLAQSVQDVQRAIDMLQKYKDISIQNLTITGLGMGANVAAMAGATDDRIKGVLMINPYNHIYTAPSMDVEGDKKPEGKMPKEIVMESRKQLDILNPEMYVSALSPKPVTIIVTMTEAGGVDEVPEIYKSAAEPKEYVSVERDGSGVSKRLGITMRTVAGFMRDVIQGKGLGTSVTHPEMTVAMTGTPLKGLDKWGKNDISTEELKNCSVESLEWVGKAVEGGKMIILNARIGKCAGNGATVISEIRGNDGALDYIQLYDDGRGSDNKAGDGIFTGSYSAPKETDGIRITIGGVGDKGEAIIEKMATIGTK
ncbi:MAG: alpha/beta fold hydrolase [bacterium]